MNLYKELRKNKHLTQVELSNILNVEQTTVSKWEVGKSTPDYNTLQKLAEFYDVSIDYLLGREKQSELKIPKELENVPVAFYEGIKDLSQDDINDVVKYIEFLKEKNKNKK